MSIFDKFNDCNCGNELKDEDEFCSNCGRKKYRMNVLPEGKGLKSNSDPIKSDMKKFAKKIMTIKRTVSRDGF